jgi:hypothetical protein
MVAKRTRLTAAVALVAAVAIASIVAVAGGSGSGSGRESSMAWSGKVQVIPSSIPTDRILYTKVENTSLEELDLVAKDVRVLDARGREVRSSASFLAAFAHGIYSWSMSGEAGDSERRRLGQIATVKPGQAIPVTVAWSVPKGGEQPVKVDFGPADVALP